MHRCNLSLRKAVALHQPYLPFDAFVFEGSMADADDEVESHWIVYNILKTPPTVAQASKLGHCIWFARVMLVSHHQIISSNKTSKVRRLWRRCRRSINSGALRVGLLGQSDRHRPLLLGCWFALFGECYEAKTAKKSPTQGWETGSTIAIEDEPGYLRTDGKSMLGPTVRRGTANSQILERNKSNLWICPRL